MRTKVVPDKRRRVDKNLVLKAMARELRRDYGEEAYLKFIEKNPDGRLPVKVPPNTGSIVKKGI